MNGHPAVDLVQSRAALNNHLGAAMKTTLVYTAIIIAGAVLGIVLLTRWAGPSTPAQAQATDKPRLTAEQLRRSPSSFTGQRVQLSGLLTSPAAKLGAVYVAQVDGIECGFADPPRTAVGESLVVTGTVALLKSGEPVLTNCR